jgi:hypothetical protein
MTNANHARRWHRGGVSRLPAFLSRRNIVSDIVQGALAGGVLAFITFQVIAHAYVTKVNGWTTMFGCGEPGNGTLLRAACANKFPGPINVPKEGKFILWLRVYLPSTTILDGKYKVPPVMQTG